MAFSLLLCCVVEAVDAEIITAKKREEKIAEKWKEKATVEETEGKDETADGKTQPAQMTDAQLEQASFKKFWDESAEWATRLVKDVIAYATDNEARDHDALMELLHRKNEVVDSESIKKAFAQNIWPPLRSRGWKAEGLDGSSKEKYFYQDETVRLYLLDTLVSLLSFR